MRSAATLRRNLASGQFWLLLVAFALLWLAVRTIRVQDVWQIMRHARVDLLLPWIVLNGGVLAALNSRWWLFLQMQGYALPFFALLRYRIAGFGVSYFTPGPHVGGEPVQIVLVHRRHDVPVDAAVAAVALDKAFDLFFNFAFLAGSLWLALQSGLFASHLGRGGLVYAVLWLLMPLGAFGAYRHGLRPISAGLHWVATQLGRVQGIWRVPTNVLHPLEPITQAIYRSETQLMVLCQRDAVLLLYALLISVGIWVLLILEFWLSTRVVGLNLTLMQAVMVMTAARVAILLPLPAGLGALEAALVLAMQALGLDAAAGIGLSLLIRTRDVALGLLGLWFTARDLGRAQFFPSGVRRRA